MKLLQMISAWLYPDKCVLCGKLLQKQETDLCRSCRIDAPECPVNRSKYPYLNSWIALWYYEDKVRRSLLHYKFYGKRHYANAYARLLGMKLLREEKLDVDVITWVPISQKRKRQRGFDQVELLADKLGQELRTEPMPLLKKIRNNAVQSGIVGQAERRANVLGVYQVIDPEKIEGKRILLLDDILTTGATVGECARVLLTAGAKEVHVAVIAAARQHKKVDR
ncbi:MAG: ComF family protein [Oscillospiraceae bacterium]|nr:ComF family protein [Oscillospiraceae bacterium]